MRLRVTFSKEGWLAYSSHLDLMRVWERALRRAGMPLRYSAGYNPRPKLQLARALPLGHVGEQELIDIWLQEPVSLDDFTRSLLPVLPEGLTVKHVQQVDPGAPAMQTQVAATEYRVVLDWDGPQGEMEERIERLLASEELPHDRRGRRYNLRPLIETLRLDAVSAGTVAISMRLSADPGATGRPEAVVDLLAMGHAFARYRRTGLVLRPASVGCNLTKALDSV
ncbi:MAG: TIGR03936 family radical SAM-associated protein [Anaerolineae bacterium]|jgi:radical SAM-linked protein